MILLLLISLAVSEPCQSAAAAATADALAAKFDDHQFIFIGSTHGDLKIEELLTCFAPTRMTSLRGLFPNAS